MKPTLLFEFKAKVVLENGHIAITGQGGTEQVSTTTRVQFGQDNDPVHNLKKIQKQMRAVMDELLITYQDRLKNQL
jgi:threonine aldolase